MKHFKILTLFALISLAIPFYATATPNNLHIIPEAQGMTGDRIKEGAEKVEKVGKDDGRSVIERYNEQAKEISDKGDLGMAFQTGIMSRDTLLSYAVYLMRFLNQIGLLIGACMILYAGYQYAGTIFKFGDATKGKNAIKNAIIGMLVIIFSYAIRKGLESMFL